MLRSKWFFLMILFLAGSAIFLFFGRSSVNSWKIVNFPPLGNRYTKLAKKIDSVLVPDILKGVLGDSSLMADGIHPNARGYMVMAERISKTVRPYLQ